MAALPPDLPLLVPPGWLGWRYGQRARRFWQARRTARACGQRWVAARAGQARQHHDFLSQDALADLSYQIREALCSAGLAEWQPRAWAWSAQTLKRASRAFQKGALANPSPQQPLLTYSPDMDPLAYEDYCAALLAHEGWQVEMTPLSGDQGADVIASCNGVKLVVQCKLYSKPVGNKAVQEVVAARQFHQAQMAVVASNARYTRSARELAAGTGVLLLHHAQLPALRPWG
ncbi:restriction endonuclease [Formicincola oecophyllae]|uniref:restriction endonuclease n=1 Tax=Formicincola oecophyllae TaxID=2558361 RepID=UPI001F106C8B|nr:restriction endonuclease [Formicincola oecophyllae]